MHITIYCGWHLAEKTWILFSKESTEGIPVPDIHTAMNRIVLKGEVTSPVEPKPICRFAARCPYVRDSCIKDEPELVEVRTDHWAACPVNAGK